MIEKSDSSILAPTEPLFGQVFTNRAGYHVCWGGSNVGWIPLISGDGTAWDPAQQHG